MIKVTANLMAILFICPSKYNNDIYLEYLNAKLFIFYVKRKVAQSFG